MAGYQLWLDESGDFKDEAAKRSQRMKGSLVGGILVREEAAGKIPYGELISRGKNHATELSGSEKKEYVLPMLERLNEQFGAQEVFFENAEYEDSLSNRQLYLRIMAEGLLQLMLRLNAVNEDVQLKVLIARRQDADAPADIQQRIQEKEYIHAIQACIKRKKKERRLILHRASALSFHIGIANRTEKLQLADFACNTRLTRDSAAFRQERERLDKLYENAYIFSLSEISSETYINMCLTQGMLSDALIELYTTQDKLDRQEIIDLICDKMEKWSYRLMKSQLRQCGTKLVGLIAQEDDYEIGESMLKAINKELTPRFLSFGGNFAEFQFVILINLADMYLREGDILEARTVLDQCGQVHLRMGEQLEHLLSYYQLQEKLALYDIVSFQYEKAQKRLENTVESFQHIMEAVKGDKNLSGRFPNVESEYLGDALCMLLYAMMFRQRKNPHLYDEMRRYSDLAMGQYPANEGELERHRQYRSHIELEAGNLEAALGYLMQAKTYEAYERVTKGDIEKFLDAVAESEVTVSCQYYLMYFLLIMEAARRKRHPMADWMHQALQAQKRLYGIMEIPEKGKEYPKEDFPNKINLVQVQEKATKIQYHPMEIVYWKYGSFLRQNTEERDRKRARHYLRRAEELCFKYPEYLTMRITGLGIEGELIQLLCEDKKRQEAEKRKKDLERKMNEILELELDQGTRTFVRSLKEKYDTGNYLEMADLITY